MNNKFQRGVALVSTLIMLSVVVLMAVAFLAVSRRERASVTVTQSQTVAKLMADSALARAQAEAISRMLAPTNLDLFNYDLMVSTNYINGRGFLPQTAGSAPNPINVSYVNASGQTLNQNDQRQNIANLLYDPRPPVYIATNAAGAQDFRFYLDFNRNGFFETNGLLREIDRNREPTRFTNFFVGDPEWIGVLQHPDQTHSGSNLFIGRYAFIVLPAGKTLDLNFIHNQAKRPPVAGRDGFYRNQGVGAWEINLAGFLRDLNTNIWTSLQYNYTPEPQFSSTGWAFEDALALLRYRYDGTYTKLSSVQQMFNPSGVTAIRNNYIDSYTDGRPPQNRDITAPWPGSDSPRSFFDGQELFALGKQSLATPDNNLNRSLTNFTGRLIANSTLSSSTYDRYTLYRLLAQLGDDSVPATAGKLNLNYNNIDTPATNFVAWTNSPANFFNLASSHLLHNQGFIFGATNIQIYPTNFFTHEVHRLLQLTANIYDASRPNEQKVGPGFPDLPTVFVPLFLNRNGFIFISGFVEEKTSAFLGNRWLDMNVPAQRAQINGEVNVHGVPIIIGVKKGYPNFNEFALQTAVQITRRVELRKSNALDKTPFQTNQMYVVGISNAFGLEAWNSYTNVFARPLEVRATNFFTLTLSNAATGRLISQSVTVGRRQSLPTVSWQGGDFKIYLQTNLVALTNAAFVVKPSPHFIPYTTNVVFERGNGFYLPQWTLLITNRVQYILIDSVAQRVVDFVTLTNVSTGIDLGRELVGNLSQGAASEDAEFWRNDLLAGVPRGIRNQIRASQGELSADWNSFNFQAAQGQDKQKAIKKFREFTGLDPSTNLLEFGTSMQAPYTPTRKLYQSSTWQANDPLVHYTLEDLTDLERTNNIQFVKPPNISPTNSNLGKLNDRYNPWGGSTNKTASSDPRAYDLAMKDPLIRRSDDWDFPTNKFANIGLLGRVHRGTPWQTVYFKSSAEPMGDWQKWSGGLFPQISHPTNDWLLADIFTTALNDNAARGLLSVNQTNLAAWSAVLSAVTVVSNNIPDGSISLASIPRYTTNLLEPSSPQLYKIVDSIMQARARYPNGRFDAAGDVLSAPALTVESPFLNTAPELQQKAALTDADYERIPQQILSLLKADEPRLVVYAYGQALQPAPNSRVLAPGQFFQLCTNYQITGEVVTKTMLKIVSERQGTNLLLRAVAENFNSLPPE